MKTFSVVALAAACIVGAVAGALNQKRTTSALDDVLRFAELIKSELRFHRADFDTIYDSGKKQRYGGIVFENGEIKLAEFVGGKYADDFNAFISRIGTTDESGQLALCDEYCARFLSAVNERKKEEKSKIQVNTALGVLGALCVLIFFF